MPIIDITLPTTAPITTTPRPTKNSHGSENGRARPASRKPTNMMLTAVQAAGVFPWLADMVTSFAARWGQVQVR